MQKRSENVCVHSEKELPSSGAEKIRKGLELRDSNDPGPVNRKPCPTARTCPANCALGARTESARGLLRNARAAPRREHNSNAPSGVAGPEELHEHEALAPRDV